MSGAAFDGTGLFVSFWAAGELSAGCCSGDFYGFVMPPLSMHTASMHLGYNLFNVGFSGGILAFAIVCILRAFGMESDSVLIWKEGQNIYIGTGLFLYFLIAIVFGFLISGRKIGGLKKIMGPPRAGSS